MRAIITLHDRSVISSFCIYLNALKRPKLRCFQAISQIAEEASKLYQFKFRFNDIGMGIYTSKLYFI